MLGRDSTANLRKRHRKSTAQRRRSTRQDQTNLAGAALAPGHLKTIRVHLLEDIDAVGIRAGVPYLLVGEARGAQPAAS